MHVFGYRRYVATKIFETLSIEMSQLSVQVTVIPLVSMQSNYPMVWNHSITGIHPTFPKNMLRNTPIFSKEHVT